MRILVIDDLEQNIMSAKQTLAGHEVTTIDNIKDAYEFLKGSFATQGFHALLTDLHMPLGPKFEGNMSYPWKNRPETLPAGAIFALKAAGLGIRTVICTDASHHADWMCTLLDVVGFWHKEKRLVSFVDADCAHLSAFWDPDKKEIIPDQEWYKKGTAVKDWNKAMEESGLFPELFT